MVEFGLLPTADPRGGPAGYRFPMRSLGPVLLWLRMPSRRSLVIHLVLIAIGIGLTMAGVVLLVADKPPAVEPASMSVTVGLLIPMMVLLLFRYRWPLQVLVVNTAMLMAIRLLDVPEFQVSSLTWVISLYAVGRYGHGLARQLVRATAILAVASLWIFEASDAWGELDRFGFTERTFVVVAAAEIGWNVLVFVGAWFAGDLGRNRANRERELAARTMELEASREENARRAVMDERIRIARELHDVVAHHVSVMGVQAGAARRAVATDPAMAEGPLRDIESSSREAVTELHRLLGFLRRADEVDPDGISPGALDPNPGLDRLDELRRQLAGAGLALRITVTGDERALPPSVDLNAYRILQEALTNCLKYAGVDQAEVELDYDDERLRLAVGDRGRGPAPSTPSGPTGTSGVGLLGMAERVALLGGRLRHGARPGGGFEVVAELPYAAEASAAPPASAAAPDPTEPATSPASPASSASAVSS